MIQGLFNHLKNRKIAALYAPGEREWSIGEHIGEAVAWLKRAQDSGNNRGVSYGVLFGNDFFESYPETTGYICQTFVDRYRLTGERELLDRALEMARWEADIQLPSGAVMDGIYKKGNENPAVFDTGMVLLGWSAILGELDDERIKTSAIRAADWLVSVQESDGNWIRGNSQKADPSNTLYNVKAAWGLCELGARLGEELYVDAAVRNGEYCLSKQLANGWFPNCCLTDPEAPLLHTLAYSMQGLVGIGKLTGRTDLIGGAQRFADSLFSLMGEDGFLPGRINKDMSAAVTWCCLTGSAQTSIVWSELYELTGQARYREAATRVNGYLMRRHDVDNTDERLRGGLPGSWPVGSDYGKHKILNWATKFLVDALTLETRSSG